MVRVKWRSFPLAVICAAAVAAPAFPAWSAEQKPAEHTKIEGVKDGGRSEEGAEPTRAAVSGPAGLAECRWLGERAVGLMWRDDLDTAFRHLDLYDRFGCPGEHIQVSFRCVVQQGIDSKATEKFDQQRVHLCWMDPLNPPPPAPPPAEKPGTK
jgi:hypothetical protein